MVAVFRILIQNPAMAASSVFLIVFACAAAFAPMIAPYDPIQVAMERAFSPPSLRHMAGTDNFGRDVFSRIIYGARNSLSVGVIATFIGVLVGVPVGLVSGFYGGLVDSVAMRIIDLILAFPGIILALVVIALLGSSLPNLMIAVGIRFIPDFARVIRGTTLSAKENPYVEAARSIGCSGFRVLSRHIFPNVIAPTIVLASLTTGIAVIHGAALSFLGLGVQPPIPEWGSMLSSGRVYIASAWWLTVFPGLALAATVLAPARCIPQALLKLSTGAIVASWYDAAATDADRKSVV